MAWHDVSRVISLSTPSVIYSAVTNERSILLKNIAYLSLINRISVYIIRNSNAID